MITKKFLNELTYEVIGSAIEVHKTMGIGLLENVYGQCMREELSHRGINFLSEMKIPVIYREKTLNIDFRCDLFVEDCLVIEIKAVKEMTTIYEAQLLTYMKLLHAPKGILFNFNCTNIFNGGQKTFVNEYFTNLTSD